VNNFVFPRISRVNKLNGMKATMRFRQAEKGFSAIELMIVVTIALAVTAMAVVAFQPALKDAQNDAAMRETMDAIRQARQYAITYRRYVQLTFSTASPSTITATQRNSLTITGASDTVLFTIAIPTTTGFYLSSTTPDTPDAFGHCAAICVEGTSGGPAFMYFQSDGEFVDGTYTSMNGSLFLGVSGQPTTYRAVTILGSTGRVREWKYGSAWTQQ
jgi:type II secretory pathway pseudopilin PulG